MINNNQNEKKLSLKISFFASIFLLFFMIGLTSFSFFYFFISEVNKINSELNSTIEITPATINEAIVVKLNPISLDFDNYYPFFYDTNEEDFYEAGGTTYSDASELKFANKNAKSELFEHGFGNINFNNFVGFDSGLSLEKIDSKLPLFELARDSLIIGKDGDITTNGVFNFETFDIEKLVKKRDGVFFENIGDRLYLFKKISSIDNQIIFTREISYIKDFVIKMFLVGIISSVLFFIFVFILSNYLIKLFLKPINENNKKLKEYNHNLAHEIKTPLTVLNMNLELLEGEENLDIIASNKEEIEKIKNITDSLLFLSENFTLKEIQKIKLNSSIKEFVEQNKEKDKFELIYNKSEIEVSCNKNMFERLLKNLSENALKYSSDNKVKIEVKDNKIIFSNNVIKCLDANELDKIFEAFYQIDYSRNKGGYGLGLTLVKRIVDIFAWQIIAKCKGKIFYIEIILGKK